MNTPEIETVPFGLLYPSLLQVAPGTGKQWLDYALANAVADVARDTRVLRTSLMLDAQANVAEYPIDVPEGYTLGAVDRVCVLGVAYTISRDLACQTVGAGACAPNFGCQGTLGENRVFDILQDGKVLRVSPPPGIDFVDGITVDMSLIPSRVACELPKVVYEQFASVVTDVALLHLMTSPSLKVAPRTLALIQNRAQNGVRNMRSIVSGANAVGSVPILSTVGQFLT